MIRPLLMIVTLVGASAITLNYSAHHSGTKSAFEALYMHLVPAPLVNAGEGHGAEEHGAAEAEEEPSGEHAAGGHAAEGDDAAEQGGGHGHSDPLLALPLPGFLGMFGYESPDVESRHLVLYNLQVFQFAAVILILIGFSGVPRYLKTGKGDWITRVLAGFSLYVRDEMVAPHVGREHATKLLPLFLSLFFFILFMNLAGLVPGSVTPTASIFVTAGLSLITFGVMIGGGMLVQGPVAFWKNLVPHVPFWLWPLLFVIELIGLIVKPVALTIRLFANMTGGHMVVLSFMGLIFFFGQSFSAGIGYAIAPVAVGFAVFIMIIEGFVAFVQAYVFAVLSAIFVGMSLHPEH